MDKKMHLGSAGADTDSNAKPGISNKRQGLQNVGPQKAGLQPNRKEAIEGCCGASPIKARGFKKN